MRVGIFVVSAIVGGASVAFAQSDWVVDPWDSAAPLRASRSAEHTARARGVPALHENARLAWVDEPNFDLADPWVTGPRATPGSPTNTTSFGDQARAVGAPGEWAKPVPLVVDPWAAKPVKSWRPSDDLILDPWADDRARR